LKGKGNPFLSTGSSGIFAFGNPTPTKITSEFLSKA